MISPLPVFHAFFNSDSVPAADTPPRLGVVRAQRLEKDALAIDRLAVFVRGGHSLSDDQFQVALLDVDVVVPGL